VRVEKKRKFATGAAKGGKKRHPLTMHGTTLIQKVYPEGVDSACSKREGGRRKTEGKELGVTSTCGEEDRIVGGGHFTSTEKTTADLQKSRVWRGLG